MASSCYLNIAALMMRLALFVAAVLTAPSLLTGQEFAPQVVEPAPGLVEPAPFVGTARQPHYWIVSSRRSPQGVNDPCRGPLEYYERLPCGSLVQTSAPGMVSQFQPGVPVSIFIHGSFVTWEDNLQEAELAYCWIRNACPDRPLHVVFFTWPSDRTTVLFAACELIHRGKQSEFNALHLACLLANIPDCHPVCMIGHSYGARMALAALHLAGGGTVQGYAAPAPVGRKRLRAVLAAGAADHQWLNDCNRYDRALCRSECVLNLRNRHDLVLKSYFLLRPFAHRPIGNSGVTRWDRRRQQCTSRIRDLDVSNYVGWGHVWPNYFGSVALGRAISSWVYFPESNPPLMYDTAWRTPADPYAIEPVPAQTVPGETLPPRPALVEREPGLHPPAAPLVDAGPEPAPPLPPSVPPLSRRDGRASVALEGPVLR